MCVCACVSHLIVYISEKGSDENGDGSDTKPFKSVLQAMRSAGKEPFPVMYVDGKGDDQVLTNDDSFLLDNHVVHVEMGGSITESVEKKQKILGKRATC